MDLQTEQVVQKWDSNGSSIQSMFPTFKSAQTSLDPTFLCANNQTLFLMDTRSKTHAKSTTFNYATNPKLSVGGN